jgi:alpha-beta hydrolase superfamily lysophospholipase
MLKREVDELILGLAADDLAALACDLPGHGWVSKGRLSGPGLSRMLA